MHKLSFIPKNIIVAISLATLIVNVIKTCPVVCTCKWKGGKRKVECVDKNLTTLLTNIDVETQVLDYAENRLRILDAQLFERANLINLQKLYMAECHISDIHATAFRGLTNLIELDLCSNELAELPPPATFADLPLLMKLTLAANPIHTLRTGAFQPLKYLSTLDLSNCQLETVEADAFDGLRKLEWLKLEGNRLKTLKSPHTLPVVGSGLSLQRNPWHCDCHLRNFQRWLTNASAVAHRRLVAEPVCVEPPTHQGIEVARLKIDDLACAPYVAPSSLFVEIDEGKNISFLCRVSAVPEAHITWDFEGNPLNGNSSLVFPFYKYYAEDETTDQMSELVVFEAKKENNGTYRCTAQNAAGTSTSNYTLNVIVVKTEAPQTLTVSHLHVLFSSVSTLIVVVFLVLLVILCLIYVNHKKSDDKRKRGATKSPRIEPKSRAEYEIIKQTSGSSTSNSVSISTAATTANKNGCVGANVGKIDANPDLIINTENSAGKEMVQEQPCERLLLLPGDIKQTYLTVAGNTLMNTTIYESKAALCAHDHYLPYQPQHHHETNNPNQVTLIPAQVVPPNERSNTIKLYLAPSATAPKFRNLHVNPFDGSIEQNCWTLQLAEDEDCVGETRHVLIDCYSSQPTICPKTALPCASSDRNFANLRHNLEGYPYPSKLKLKSLKTEQVDDEIVNTPILSPPDPFKTGTEIPPTAGGLESAVNL